MQSAHESLQSNLPVILTCLFIHCAKLFRCESAASEHGDSCWYHIIRGTVMTGNILYLSLITWVSLTSIKEMGHSPAEFTVGRWSWHSCLGRQVERGNWDPSESTVFSRSDCAICYSMIVFKRKRFNSFREQLSRTDDAMQITWRDVNLFKGRGVLYSLSLTRAGKEHGAACAHGTLSRLTWRLWRGRKELSCFQMGS